MSFPRDGFGAATFAEEGSNAAQVDDDRAMHAALSGEGQCHHSAALEEQDVPAGVGSSPTCSAFGSDGLACTRASDAVCMTCFSSFCLSGGHSRQHAEAHASDGTNHQVFLHFQGHTIACHCSACDISVNLAARPELRPIVDVLVARRALVPAVDDSSEGPGSGTHATESASDATAPSPSPASASTAPEPAAESGSGGGASGGAPTPGIPREICTATTSSKAQRLADRIKGLIYGNCIGDAVGLSTEFLTKPQASRYYQDKFTGECTFQYSDIIRDGHRKRWARGDWTDDSDQMILIMRGLLKSPTLHPDRHDFGERLWNWMHSGFPECGDYAGLGIGYTVHSVLVHPKFKENPHVAAKLVWEGSGCYLAANGAIMRTSVLAVPHFYDPEQVVKDTLEIAHTTHADPRSTAGAVAVTAALAAMLREEHFDALSGEFDVDAIAEMAYEAGAKHLTDLKFSGRLHPSHYTKDSATRDLRTHMFASSQEDLELDADGMIGYAYKCAGSGFVAFRSGKPFKQAIGDLVKEAGDADTNAAVAGALLGCKCGYERLPQDWLRQMPHLEFLDRHVDALLRRLIPTLPAEYAEGGSSVPE